MATLYRPEILEEARSRHPDSWEWSFVPCWLYKYNYCPGSKIIGEFLFYFLFGYDSYKNENRRNHDHARRRSISDYTAYTIIVNDRQRYIGWKARLSIEIDRKIKKKKQTDLFGNMAWLTP